MADLDDFFAKRDKSKKSKKKFDTAEELAKVLDQKVKEKKKLETGKSNFVPEGGRQSPALGLPAGDDDEWIEAEEKLPDYSNLKIQELILESDDDEIPTQEGREDTEGANEGPWNKTQSKSKEKEEEPEGEKEKVDTDDAAAASAATTSTTTTEEPKEQDTDKAESADNNEPEEPRKYVPPSMRNKRPEVTGTASPASAPSAPSTAAAGGGGAYVPPSRRGAGAAAPASAPPVMIKKKGAPSLGDQESFPSLT